MSTPQQLVHHQQPKQIQQRPRFGGGGGGGGDRQGGPTRYNPRDVSEIFQLLRQTSEGFFNKESLQPVPEGVIRELHIAVFNAIAESTEDKEKLLGILRSMADQANDQRLARGSQLSSEQMGEKIREATGKIIDCFFP